VSAHLAKTIAAKPALVQISTTYGAQEEGSPALPRNKYTAIRDDRPKDKEEAKRPEFKECKFTIEAIITEGEDVGTIHKVCMLEPDLPGSSSEAVYEPGRCEVEGRTGEAAQGTGNCQYGWTSRSERHWLRRPCASNEARLAVSDRAAFVPDG